MTPPLVSVVMSVYNGERFLAESLDSVLGQEGVEFEVVAVDDGSTDGTPAILAERAKRDARLRVIRQENTGLTRALNRACSEARGAFLARHDADDLSLPGRLARLTDFLRSRSGAVVASSWTLSIGPLGESLTTSRFPVDDDAVTTGVLEGRSSVVHAAAMFSKRDFERAGGYRSQFYFAQDSDLWFRMGELGGFCCLPEPLYAVRISEGSLTSRFRAAQVRLYGIALELRKARIEGRSEDALLAEAECLRPGRLVAKAGDSSAGAWFLARTLLKNRDARARRYAIEFVKRRPFHPKGWACLLQAALLRAS